MRKYPVAREGGNWQGVEYLTYAEHDRCVRAAFKIKGKDEKSTAYRAEMEEIIQERKSHA